MSKGEKLARGSKMALWFVVFVLYIGVAVCTNKPEDKVTGKENIPIDRAPETIMEYLFLSGTRLLRMADTVADSFFSYKIITDAMVHGLFVRVILILKLCISVYFICNFSKNRKDGYKYIKQDLEYLGEEESSKKKEKEKKETPEELLRRISNNPITMEEFLEMNRRNDPYNPNPARSSISSDYKKLLPMRILNKFVVALTKIIYNITLFNSFGFLIVLLSVYINHMTKSSISRFLEEKSPVSCTVINMCILGLEVMASRYIIILMGCLGVLTKSLSVYYNALLTKNKTEKAKKVRNANASMLKSVITKTIVIFLVMALDLNTMMPLIEPGCMYFLSNAVLMKVEAYIRPAEKKEIPLRRKNKQKEEKYSLQFEMWICKLAIGVSIVGSIAMGIYVIWNGVDVPLNHPLLLRKENALV